MPGPLPSCDACVGRPWDRETRLEPESTNHAGQLTMCPHDTTTSQQRFPFPKVGRLLPQIARFLKYVIDGLRVRDPQAILLHTQQ